MPDRVGYPPGINQFPRKPCGLLDAETWEVEINAHKCLILMTMLMGTLCQVDCYMM